MLAKTGLLILSNPQKIGKILSSVQKQVKNTLYIQLLSALSEPFGSFHTNVFNAWPTYSQTIFGIYSQAAAHCKDLDVRVLLSGIKYNIPKIQTQSPIDLVIFDKLHNQNDIDNFMKQRIENLAKEYKTLTIDSGDFENFSVNNEDNEVKKHVVLGGTFDRLHIAHKLLLSEAILRSNDQVTVGITEENMLQTKTLWELIEPFNVRKENVSNYLNDVCKELKYNVVPISDPFGPAIVDPSIELIVVSKETIRGGEKINEIRKERNLPLLVIKDIELIDEPDKRPIEENKISSSTARIRLLGTLLKSVKSNKNLPSKPYVIGLAGGIASGKSNVANYLNELGALIIDCDKIGHSVYKYGTPCYKALVEHFGNEIVGPDNEIDRKKLGPIVFKDHKQMDKLNSLVWPAIAEEVQNIINNTDKQVVVIEAAVLLTAGWDKMCHEVWTTLVPKPEAIERLKSRNNLQEDQAKNRIEAQPNNSTYVNNSNVVFCTLWEKDFTKEQVKKAWQLLESRLNI